MVRGQRDSLYFEWLGADFDRFMSDYDVTRRSWLIAREIGRLGGLTRKQVLEVGCGTGRISKMIAECGCRLTVNDISPRLTAAVSAKIGCAGIPGDCLQLPLADSSFDAVISSECIEHTQAPYDAVREMYRVLRPGGPLVLTTPNKLWYPILWLSERFGVRKFRGIEHWTWPREMRVFLHSLGFRHVRFSGCHLLPWQIPFAKEWLPLADRVGEQLYPVMINYLASGTKGDGVRA